MMTPRWPNRRAVAFGGKSAAAGHFNIVHDKVCGGVQVCKTKAQSVIVFSGHVRLEHDDDFIRRVFCNREISV